MSVLNEIKQNVLINAYNLVYSAKVNMNAGDSTFMEGTYSDFLRQMDILIASTTDEVTKKELKSKIDGILKNAEERMARLNPINTDAYTIDTQKKKFMLDAMIDTLIDLSRTFYEKGYIEASFLENMRNNLLARLYDAVQDLSPDAVWISTELIMVAIQKNDAVNEIMEGLKQIRKTVAEGMKQELEGCSDPLKRSHIHVYWQSVEMNKKLELIVSVLSKYNLIGTSYET